MKKKILLCLGLGIIGIFVLGIVLVQTGLVGINLRNIKTREESIIVSINPKVMYNTDDKGYVKEVIPMNKDALIYKEEDFLGLYINDAFEKTVKVAMEHGYVEEGTEINISSLSEDSVYLEDIIYTIGNTNLNIKTKKLSKRDIEDIKINLSNGEYTVWQEITVDEQGVSVEGEYSIVPDKEEVENRDDTYKPELHGKENNTNKDEEPSNWQEIGDGFYQAESVGYGDYVEGTHVSLVPDGPQYYKFFDTSKFGCKDAKDKKACANWWINDLTPKMESVKRDLDTTKTDKAFREERVREYEQDLIKLENEIKVCELEADGCGHGFDGTHLNDLYGYRDTKVRQIEIEKEVIVQDQQYIDVLELSYNEYVKAVNVYKAVLNN